jgi:hypothetical protein
MSTELIESIKLLPLTVLKKELSDFNKSVKISGYSKLNRDGIEKLILKHADKFQHLIAKAKEHKKEKVVKPTEKKEVEKPTEESIEKKEVEKQSINPMEWINFRDKIRIYNNDYGIRGKKLGVDFSKEEIGLINKYITLQELRQKEEKESKEYKKYTSEIREMRNTDLKIQKKIKIDDKICNIVHYKSIQNSSMPNIGIIIGETKSSYKLLKINTSTIGVYSRSDKKGSYLVQGYYFPKQIDLGSVITLSKDKTKPFYIYEKVFKSDIDLHIY